MCLNTGSQAVGIFGTVVEHSGDGALLEDVCHWDALDALFSLFPDCECNLASCFSHLSSLTFLEV